MCTSTIFHSDAQICQIFSKIPHNFISGRGAKNLEKVMMSIMNGVFSYWFIHFGEKGIDEEGSTHPHSHTAKNTAKTVRMPTWRNFFFLCLWICIFRGAKVFSMGKLTMKCFTIMHRQKIAYPEAFT